MMESKSWVLITRALEIIRNYSSNVIWKQKQKTLDETLLLENVFYDFFNVMPCKRLRQIVPPQISISPLNRFL